MADQKYYLYSSTARKILTAMSQEKDCVDISVDLNKSTTAFHFDNDKIIFDKWNVLDKTQLQIISKKENRVFLLEEGVLDIVECRNDGYYKLVPTEGTPTAEINGVKMHRSKGIDPFKDAEKKARDVVRANDTVLDTCCGLGYTAIWAVRLGAKKVLSVEYNEAMLKLRRLNPWSQELFCNSIELIVADVSEFVQTLESESFDSIIHDPPRLSLAGQLYGEKFYAELHRVLRRNGRLFHYTGNPHRIRRGNSFLVNVAKRLKRAGFKKVMLKEDLLGVKAIK